MTARWLTSTARVLLLYECSNALKECQYFQDKMLIDVTASTASSGWYGTINVITFLHVTLQEKGIYAFIQNSASGIPVETE